MAKKDPRRWDEVIIKSPYGSLTKRDVFDYYQRPEIKRRILQAVRSTGTNETIIRQNFSPEQVVLRRKDPHGNFINLRKAKDFDNWTEVRMSEIHPVFGKKTNLLLADIDPGEKVPWRKTKSITETIAKIMSDSEDVKNVQVQFSGDRGFYVKGILGKKIDVDQARKKVKNLLKSIAQRPDVTLAKAKVDQIRIDTTPLKFRGSVKAPYSLSSRTGLVAAPVKLEDLPKVRHSDFRINKVKIAEKEFAPGIPVSRKIDPIPTIKNKAWKLSIQKHKAHVAGKHYDLRLIDPSTGKAHSFAIPKARLPSTKKILLAIQQPTHTADYALNFQGKIPEGTYGAGEVTWAKKPRDVKILKASPDKLVFEEGKNRFALFRMKGNNWGFKKMQE